MTTKVPEKILVNSLLKKLEASRNDWTTEEREGSQVIKRSTHNTAIVIHALTEAAREAGYIGLMFALIGCEIDKLEESNQ